MKHLFLFRLNLVLLICVIALVMLAIAGIVLNLLGFRFYQADNGSKFLGKTIEGVVLKGTVVYADGSRAKLDRRLGTLVFDNGDVYEGDFSGFYRSGSGKMTYAASGDVYTGSFAEDKIDGYGVYRAADGSVYEGEFSDGKKNGSGKYTWSDGSVYEGGFLDNRKEGTGTYTDVDGESYTGEYHNDRKNGIGTAIYPNGDRYTGSFVDDLREGTGTYTFANGESYTGEFHNNLRNGKGVYHWPAPTERSYEGYFENGAVKVVDEDEDVNDTGAGGAEPGAAA